MFSSLNHSASGIDTVASFPLTPTNGRTVLHSGADMTFTWNGSRWLATSGNAEVITAGGGLAARDAAVVVAGIAVPCDVDVHGHADGICALVEAGNAVLVNGGDVDGFAGLVDGGTVFVGASAGAVSQTRPVGKSRIPLGRARSATRVNVYLDEPTVI